MGRKVNQTAIYQGLFLLAFGLYANATRSPRKEAVAAPESRPRVDIEKRSESQNDPLQDLYGELERIPVFQGKIEGVGLKISGDSILIEIQSDELYRPGGVEVEPVWHSSLIQIGQELYSELDPSLALEITGFGPLGESRAKWLSEYFKSQFQRPKVFSVRLFVVDEQMIPERIRLRVIQKRQ
jgi:hypothetical protein